MAKENQPKEQSHRAGERIVAAISKDIKRDKDDSKLAWSGCPKFFPPVGLASKG